MSSIPVLVREVQALRARLSGGACGADAGQLIELVAALEELKSAACAAQAEAAAAFDGIRREERAIAGVPESRQGRGIAHEIALARKESPFRGRTLLGLGKALVAEMPHTLARLRDGTLSEHRAQILVQETACLTREDRSLVDRELCSDPSTLTGVGNRTLTARAKRLGAELDPAALARRARKAEADRHVSIRPAPDTMGYLSVLLPVGQAVAAYAALRRAAEGARAAGDPRSLGQLMSDLALARLTGVPDSGNPEQSPAVPVGVNLCLSTATLAGGHAPASLTAPGVGEVTLPAEVARLLLSRALSTGVGAWFRRLFYNPQGTLVAMSSRRRVFPTGMADFLAQRGLGICANPYCDAPVRHADHIRSVVEGGATTTVNGQGLCEACNHAKQAAGWRQRAIQPRGHRLTVETTTPTGHRYRSRAPAPPGWHEPFPLEIHFLTA
ncbi:DUF222 domain-containing protein [Nocardioides dubius]|uniref:DUF222 domain-containing protein n=1 Tax=Nocardioides dubius TaxID=317019 RepID=A0ABP4EKB8_9ACTN